MDTVTISLDLLYVLVGLPTVLAGVLYWVGLAAKGKQREYGHWFAPFLAITVLVAACGLIVGVGHAFYLGVTR